MTLLFHYGRRGACDALLLAASQARDDADLWRKALGFLREAKEPRLPFGGNDLLARGIKDGKAVGETLRLLEARWIEAGFPEDAQSLKALLNSTGQFRRRLLYSDILIPGHLAFSIAFG